MIEWSLKKRGKLPIGNSAMTREIKFRRWDGKRMDFDPIVMELSGVDIHINSMKLWDCDDIYMQYTGLKDKNGKEIYEGDIVTFGYGEEDRYEIFFERGFFQTRGGRHGIWNYAPDRMEIIGNIWENPELLK